jgi:hypothetical protein
MEKIEDSIAITLAVFVECRGIRNANYGKPLSCMMELEK